MVGIILMVVNHDLDWVDFWRFFNILATFFILVEEHVQIYVLTLLISLSIFRIFFCIIIWILDHGISSFQLSTLWRAHKQLHLPRAVIGSLRVSVIRNSDVTQLLNGRSIGRSHDHHAGETLLTWLFCLISLTGIFLESSYVLDIKLGTVSVLDLRLLIAGCQHCISDLLHCEICIFFIYRLLAHLIEIKLHILSNLFYLGRLLHKRVKLHLLLLELVIEA